MTLRKEYPENCAGPFYVEQDLCILCGAPEAVAPNLVEMSSKNCDPAVIRRLGDLACDHSADQ